MTRIPREGTKGTSGARWSSVRTQVTSPRRTRLIAGGRSSAQNRTSHSVWLAAEPAGRRGSRASMAGCGRADRDAARVVEAVAPATPRCTRDPRGASSSRSSARPDQCLLPGRAARLERDSILWSARRGRLLLRRRRLEARPADLGDSLRTPPRQARGVHELPGAERVEMAAVQLKAPGETLTSDGEAWRGVSIEHLTEVLDLV
jgi:hypothetical protein